jgi:arginyl-tRNA synthetase
VGAECIDGIFDECLIMYAFEQFRQEVGKAMQKALGKRDETIAKPPSPELGDLCSTIAFRLGGDPKKNAEAIATKISLPKDSLIRNVEVSGAYINFFFREDKFSQEVLDNIFKLGDRYGTWQLHKGKKAIIEHTSTNPNASPHVGRARNAIIGDSLKRVLQALGYELEVQYFVNDVGKQVSMLVWALKDKDLSQLKFSDMLGEYVRANQEIKANPELESEVLYLQQKFESGDKDTLGLFKKIVDTCIKGQREVLESLNITYDKFVYESKFLFDGSSKKVFDRVSRLKQTKVQGKVVFIDLNEFGIEKEMVLTREDGTTLYPVRDLAYHVYKLDGANLNFGVYGVDHQLHMTQLRKTLELMLGDKAKTLNYIFYGFIVLPEGKMSTRTGNVVLLEDFLKEALKRAYDEVQKRWPDMPEKEKTEIAKQIAVGAVRYSIIRIAPQKTMTFLLEQALSFEGETAPFIQYSHARATRIIEKAGVSGAKHDASYLKEKEEKELLSQLAAFPEVVRESAETMKPYLVANYAYDLADKFNTFYHSCRVIGEDPGVEAARLALVNATKIVLKNALFLLGIDAPERM